jgi:uncharacterized protein
MRIPLTHLEPSAVRGRLRNMILALLTLVCVTAAASAHKAAHARTLTVAVMGDSVAHDLGRGLEDLFADKRHIRVIRQTRFATGLVRTDYYDWNKVAREFLATHRPDVILVVIGGNDRQAIRVNGHRYDPLTREWQIHYARLVSRFMNDFHHSHARVYWVSLPPVRSASLTHAYRIINRIYRREAARHRFEYLDIWNKFTTPSGAYSSFGESLEGVKRRIRMQDGEHFTDIGRLVFAADVAKAIGLH